MCVGISERRGKAMKLKPCPFCKREDAILTDNSIDLHADIPGWTTRPIDFVTCACGARGPAGASEEQAIEKWNSRVGLVQ